MHADTGAPPDAAPAARPRAAVAVEAAALAALAALAGETARRIGVASSVMDAPRLAVAAFAGYALADLATGVAHWLCDRVLQPDLPVVGRWLVQPFRDHHDDPLAIARHGLLEVNAASALPLLPLLAVACALPAPAPGSRAGAAALACVLALVLGAVATNQLHAWAHAPRVPRVVAWLQRRRLVLAPRAHVRHHRGAHDRAYCVTTGWWNPLLDRGRVFARLEAALARRAPRGPRRRAATT